jgi:hypothetical protein
VALDRFGVNGWNSSSSHTTEQLIPCCIVRILRHRLIRLHASCWPHLRDELSSVDLAEPRDQARSQAGSSKTDRAVVVLTSWRFLADGKWCLRPSSVLVAHPWTTLLLSSFYTAPWSLRPTTGVSTSTACLDSACYKSSIVCMGQRKYRCAKLQTCCLSQIPFNIVRIALHFNEHWCIESSSSNHQSGLFSR